MTNTATPAAQAIDNVVAVMLKAQRDRLVAKAATDLGISVRRADAIARSMGR